MPVWCENKLVISGPNKALDIFRDTLEDGMFELSQTLPPPESPPELWHSQNWGTKKHRGRQAVKNISQAVSVVFETAYLPPKEWAVTVSKRFPRLSFTFYFHSKAGPDGVHGTISVIAGHVVFERMKVAYIPEEEGDGDRTCNGDYLTFLTKHGFEIDH